jgi:cyclic dehypoxanthinyl futalosine synthase
MKDIAQHEVLKEKIDAGERITGEDALMLFEWNILDLGKAADLRRRMIYPKEEVGFIIDRIINFTNICEASCSFCAFHAKANQIDGYELSLDEIISKIDELVEGGGTQVMLQGGLHPEYTLDRYIVMLKTVRKRFPHIYLHSFSPSEVVHISRKSSLAIDEVIRSLKDAGLDSVPGASDLLVNRLRQSVSPQKASVDEWREVMHALARHDMKSSATMTYGMGETIKEKIDHLQVIRDIQDETGIIRAFIPWSFSPNNTCLTSIIPSTGIDYLTMVSISRIFLDNIVNIQAGWLTEGLKIAQIALTMGANDMGGVLTEEIVVKATGIETSLNKNDMIALIKNAEKIPAQRDSDYNVLRYY